MFPGFEGESNQLAVYGGDAEACKAVQGGLQCTFDLQPSEESLGAFGLFSDFELRDYDLTLVYGSFEFSGTEIDRLIEITKPDSPISNNEWQTRLDTWVDTLEVENYDFEENLCGGQFFTSKLGGRPVIGFVVDCGSHNVELSLFINSQAFASASGVVYGSNYESVISCSASRDQDYAGYHECKLVINGGSMAEN